MVNVYKSFYKVVGKQQKLLQEYTVGVIEDRDIEDVHQMRVAARRLRASLRFFSPLIDEENRCKVREDIRKLARYLGKVRDLDVSILYFEDYLAKVPDNKGVKYLVECYKDKRKPEKEKLDGFLISKKYYKLQYNLFVLTNILKENAKSKHPKTPLEEFSRSLEAVIDEVFSFEQKPDLKTNEETLHDLRIAIKHLRYSLEFIKLKDPEAKSIVNYLKQMQDSLGVINDCNFVNRRLAKFLKKHKLKTVQKQGIETLMAYNEALKAEEKQKIVYPWEKLSSTKIKELYMAAIK